MLIESNLQKGELKSIAKILIHMQSDKNFGHGIPYIRDLAKALKKGKVDKALNLARNSAPYIWMHPDIRRFIHDVIYPIGYIDNNTGLLVNPERE